MFKNVKIITRNMEQDRISEDEDMVKYFSKRYDPQNQHTSECIESRRESICGRGSMRELNQGFLEFLDQIIQKYEISNILDIGCGDLNYIHPFLEQNPHIRYKGMDISLPLIERNKKLFPNYDFEHANCTERISVGEYDLCIIKEVFIHISKDNVRKTLQNIQANKNIPLILVSGHTNELPSGVAHDDGSNAKYGNFTYHFEDFEGESLENFVDCGVRAFKLFPISSIQP